MVLVESDSFSGEPTSGASVLMSWDELRHPVCFLSESSVVSRISPAWCLLTRGVGESDWVWREGVNALERLRTAAGNGDPGAAEAVTALESLLAGERSDWRHELWLPVGKQRVPFVFSAVAVRQPERGVTVSLIERRESASNSPSATCAIDARGHLVEHDAGFLELLGLSEQPLGSPLLWDLLAEKAPSLAAVLRATVPAVPASQLEWRWPSEGGWVEVCWYPDSKLIRLVLNPIGPSKALSLRQFEEHCDGQSPLSKQKKLDGIRRLAGGVAHDFNNRLSEILGNAELALGGDALGDEARQAFENIVVSANRSATLVKQLLAFARQETIVPKTLSLNQSIDDLLKLRQELSDEKVRLTWAPGPENPMIKADPGQIQQILEQLVSNARDAVLQSGGGEIRISTSRRMVDEETSRRHDSVEPGLFANLEVSDDGIGLDEELASHIFEPFFTTKSSGSGMGLSTVEGIVGQNGGFVEVSSERGKGSSFTISLPLKEEASGEQPSPLIKEKPSPLGPPSTTPPARASGPEAHTVLLVDDEPGLLQLCKRRLQKMGYKVLVALGPHEAIEVARAHSGKIDLLLTDVMMPNMNGRELSVRLQEMRPGLEAVFMSGYAAEILSENGMLDQGVHFLAKPFGDAELREKLATLLPTL